MGPGQGDISFLYVMIGIFFIFYFLVIRPEKKKQKELQEMRNNIKKNDKVITAGGIYGTVVNVKEKSAIVRVDDNAKIEFDKQSLTVINKDKE